MSRVSERQNGAEFKGREAAWARRSEIPMGMVLAWLAALVVTTEGLMTFQSLFG